MLILGTVMAAGLLSGVASAASFTGTYSTGGATTPAGDPDGPWTLTWNTSSFSSLSRVTNENPDFADVTNLHVIFDSVLGGGAVGSPRLRILLDLDGSGGISGADRSITVHLGTSPSYVDTPTTLDTWSGVNMIGNNDAGRYDTSAFAGGSPFTTYASAVALLGAFDVLRLGVVADTFLPGENQLDIFGIEGTFRAVDVPEPATMALLAFGGLAVAGMRRRRSA